MPILKEEKERKQIEKILEPAFQEAESQALEVYLSILEEGAKMTYTRLEKEIIGGSRQKVAKVIRSLKLSGLILETPERKRLGARYFLINPETLFYISYMDLKSIFPPDLSLQKFLDGHRDLLDKLVQMWKKNKVGLGGEEKKVFDVRWWSSGNALANVCGWISAFREEMKTKEIFLLTPHLRLLENEQFREMMAKVLNGLRCKCTFFAEPSKDKIFRQAIKQLPPDCTYKLYHIGEFMFTRHLRVLLLDNMLGAIFLKREDHANLREDHYVGKIFYKSAEHITYLKKCLDKLTEICPRMADGSKSI